MFSGEVLEEFINPNNQRCKGFNRNQLNSIICCLQHAIKNKRNVDNNTIVYRGIGRKFPNNINIGSRFYFFPLYRLQLIVKLLKILE